MSRPTKKNFMKLFFSKISLDWEKTDKNQLQNFEKHMKQKRCAVRGLNVPNFFLFLKKIGLGGEKRNYHLLFTIFCIFNPKT